MQKRILILVAAIALGTSGLIAQRMDHDQEQPHSLPSGAAGEQEKKQRYTCVMHPDVVMDHPGNCPKCGMKLVPLKGEKPETAREDPNDVTPSNTTSTSKRRMANTKCRCRCNPSSTSPIR
jgi:hypothetical protein